jgi:hypothetical protein
MEKAIRFEKPSEVRTSLHWWEMQQHGADCACTTARPDAAHSRRSHGSRRLVRLLYASFEISDVLLKLFIHRIDGIGVISFHYLETR